MYKQPAKVSVQGPRERFSKETISQQVNFSKLEAMVSFQNLLIFSFHI